MANQITQQSKSDPKGKAIASLVFGIISVAPIVVLNLIGRIISPAMILMPFAPLITFIIGIIFPLGALIGLILGIMGLKSTKRNFAIAGIILCAVGLLIPIISFLFF